MRRIHRRKLVDFDANGLTTQKRSLKVQKPTSLLLLLTAFTLVSCGGTPINKVRLGSNDPRITIRGVLPPDTRLRLGARYISSECSKHELITPSGDISNLTWHESVRVSWISKIVAANSSSSEYSVAIPADGAGRCQWYLDGVVLTFTLMNGRVENDPDDQREVSLTLVNSASSSPATDFEITPKIYALDIEDWNDSKVKNERRLAIDDGNATDWYKSGRVEEKINLRGARNATVTVSPVILSDYKVAIVSRFIPTAWGVAKRYSQEISYPDGTVYFYTSSPSDLPPKNSVSIRRKELFPLYPPSRQESRLATLIRSNNPAEVRELAEFSEIGHAVEEDKNRAAELYEKAANGGDIPAMKWLLNQAQYRHDASKIAYWRSRISKVN
jgi:hypothetical protein